MEEAEQPQSVGEDRADPKSAEQGVVDRVLSWFKALSFSFNAAAPAFTPAEPPSEVHDELDVRDQMDRPQFSKNQVKLIIEQTMQKTSDGCWDQFQGACSKYETLISDLRVKVQSLESEKQMLTLRGISPEDERSGLEYQQQQ